MSDTQEKKTMKIPITWHYRMLGSFLIALFILSCVAVVIVIKQNLFIKQIDAIKEIVYQHTGSVGLSLDDIIIEGRDKISKQEIINLLQLDRSSSFLKINEPELEAKIQTLPWVASVKVKKKYLPNILQISLKERQVIAIWQDEQKFYALDEKGHIINTDFTPNREYVLAIGKKAPQNLLPILRIVSSNKDIFKRIKVLQFISERRWNVVFDDVKSGMIVKLPEEEIELAWKKMLKLNTTHGILKRPLTIIDLRFKDKVIVKLNKTVITKGVKENKA